MQFIVAHALSASLQLTKRSCQIDSLWSRNSYEVECIGHLPFRLVDLPLIDLCDPGEPIVYDSATTMTQLYHRVGAVRTQRIMIYGKRMLICASGKYDPNVTKANELFTVRATAGSFDPFDYGWHKINLLPEPEVSGRALYAKSIVISSMFRDSERNTTIDVNRWETDEIFVSRIRSQFICTLKTSKVQKLTVAGGGQGIRIEGPFDVTIGMSGVDRLNPEALRDALSLTIDTRLANDCRVKIHDPGWPRDKKVVIICSPITVLETDLPHERVDTRKAW